MKDYKALKTVKKLNKKIDEMSFLKWNDKKWTKLQTEVYYLKENLKSMENENLKVRYSTKTKHYFLIVK